MENLRAEYNAVYSKFTIPAYNIKASEEIILHVVAKTLKFAEDISDGADDKNTEGFVCFTRFFKTII